MSLGRIRERERERCDLMKKAILGSAVLFGMTEDLALSVVDTRTHPPTTVTTRLSWATSVFYFGMLAGLYPMTFALQRFRVGRVLGVLVVLWGAIAMLTAAVTSWRGLFAQRFFLGFVGSGVPTAFMCIVSGYYTQREQALRQSWWFSSTGGWTVIGGALNYGFAQITGGALARWQYIYLLAGSLTVLFGCACFAVPNSEVSAWYVRFGVDCSCLVAYWRHKWEQKAPLLIRKVLLLSVMPCSGSQTMSLLFECVSILGTLTYEERR